MSKADEAFEKRSVNGVYISHIGNPVERDRELWRAACEWQRQQDIQAVESEQLEHDRENCNDRPYCDDCAYQRAIQDAIGAIKGE